MVPTSAISSQYESLSRTILQTIEIIMDLLNQLRSAATPTLETLRGSVFDISTFPYRDNPLEKGLELFKIIHFPYMVSAHQEPETTLDPEILLYPESPNAQEPATLNIAIAFALSEFMFLSLLVSILLLWERSLRKRRIDRNRSDVDTRLKRFMKGQDTVETLLDAKKRELDATQKGIDEVDVEIRTKKQEGPRGVKDSSAETGSDLPKQ